MASDRWTACRSAGAYRHERKNDTDKHEERGQQDGTALDGGKEQPVQRLFESGTLGHQLALMNAQIHQDRKDKWPGMLNVGLHQRIPGRTAGDLPT